MTFGKRDETTETTGTKRNIVEGREANNKGFTQTDLGLGTSDWLRRTSNPQADLQQPLPIKWEARVGSKVKKFDLSAGCQAVNPSYFSTRGMNVSCSPASYKWILVSLFLFFFVP